MKYHTLFKLFMVIFCAISITSLNACGTTGMQVNLAPALGQFASPGPPTHAKAHGYRDKHTYRFYPDAAVYFDISSKSYFYLSGNEWKVSLTLPRTLRLNLGDCVSIEMDTDKPYTNYKEHKIKYPPGQLKKNKWAKRHFNK